MAATLSVLRKGFRFTPRISTLIRGFASDGDAKKPESYFEDDTAQASGQTTVNILNQEQEGVIFMDAYSNLGFKMSNGMRILGPCAVFPRSVLHWNVKGVEDVNEESLSLFTMLEPKLDILVIGVGDRENRSKIDPKLFTHLRSKKLGIEVLPTDQALATFNFLNAERRYVAGAFIPPNYVEELGDDMSELYESLLEYGEDPMLLKSDYHEDLAEGPGELSIPTKDKDEKKENPGQKKDGDHRS